MPIQRFDIYQLIHKGLRSYMTETLLALGKLDASSVVDTHATLTQLRGLLAFCQSHLEHENTHVHTAMNLRRPGSADAMNDHHGHHELMIEELYALANQLQDSQGQERERDAAILYRKLAVFVADNLAHMYEEETVNNAILWSCYSDEEIQAIEHAIVASIPPQKNAEVMQWMLPAMNHQERHAFLSGMRREAPRMVFESTLDIARQHLTRSDWNKLQFALAC